MESLGERTSVMFTRTAFFFSFVGRHAAGRREREKDAMSKKLCESSAAGAIVVALGLLVLLAVRTF